MQARSPSNACGIDVSHHQGIIDWAKVRADGISFAFIKATEGMTFVDPRFVANVAGARAADILVGAYHFSRAATPAEAVKEAEFYYSAVTIAAGTLDLPHVLDIESEEGKTKANISATCRAWVERMKQLSGTQPIIYTYLDFARKNLEGLQDVPLWFACYNVQPPEDAAGWKRWAFLQYTDAGNVSGIAGKVDCNEYNGTEADLKRSVKGVSKYSPQVVKERIRAVNGKLEYIPLNTGKPYSIPATDVRLLKLEKGRVRFQFVARAGGKVSVLVKEFGADYGINFPFFDDSAQLPVGTVWDGSRYVNGAWGKAQKWHTFAGKNGAAAIGQLDNLQQYDFAVQGSPLLVNNGRAVWDYYREQEEVATDIGRDASGNPVWCQRTFAGIDAAGNLLIAVADGRTGTDQGLTLEEMALYMLDKGAVVAINGDGGSSTILADRSGGLNQSQNAGTNERAVHHALLFYCLDNVPQTVGDWKQESMDFLRAQGLIDADSKHDPDAPVTWAEMGSVLRRFK